MFRPLITVIAVEHSPSRARGEDFLHWNREAEQAYAPNPAMTSLFQIGRQWRRVGDTYRSATRRP